MLKEKLLDPASGVLLYGTTPPRAGSDETAVRSASAKLAARLASLPLDGVVVYDIQDESGRTAVPRPFAFTGTIDPREYARLLTGCTGRPAITYKCVGGHDERAWQGWLDETARAFGAGFLSIVGRPTSGVRHPLALSKAIRLAAAHPAGFIIGGVAIAERHTAERSEAARLLGKSIEGCGYFISQTVYSAQASERLLADYLRDCRGASVQPRRIVLSFAPAGREKTMEFLRWLGVRIPPETAQAILGAARPLAKSIEVCCDNLRRILQHDYTREIPLGVNVESVSINRDEIDASIDLVHALSEVMRELSQSRAMRPPDSPRS
jgi:5,10-methylenetetrahydrofolate reductase